MCIVSPRHFKRLLAALLLCAVTLGPVLSVQAALPDAAHMPNLWRRVWRKGLNQVYTFDSRPLGERTPVILIPGRAEEVQFSQWWRSIGGYAPRQQAFNQHYKLYLFLYDSTHDIPALSRDLKHALLSLKPTLAPGKSVLLVSYSQGGLMAYDAMEDPGVYQMTRAHVAMAVPFYGTPMFSEAWFQQHFEIEGSTPLRRKWDLLMHRLYVKNKRTLVQHMNWNPRPRAHSTACNQAPVAESCIKSRMIVYGSYVPQKPVIEKPAVTKIAKETLKLPYYVGNQVFPFYVFSLHRVFRTMSVAVGNVPDVNDPTYFPFKLNDGVVPLSSALFLAAHATAPMPADLPGMQNRVDVQKARVFEDLDHMDYAELHRSREELRRNDLLHLQEGRRSPMEWLLYDLDQLAQPQAEL